MSGAARLLDLPLDEVHLHYALEGEIRSAELLAAYEGLLAPEERARRERYHFQKNRHQYLVTRALARSTLSRYAAVPPAAWTFSPNAWGRPEIATPAGTGLRFNLSNTEGLVVCLVARDREIGVDVEDTERQGGTVAIADRFFSASEVAELRAQADQRARFFDYWTLKEAYIKARGMGLAIPLGQFSFRLGGGTIGIAFDPRIADDPASWQFGQVRVAGTHLISYAIRRREEAPLRVLVRRVVPLLPEEDVIETSKDA